MRIEDLTVALRPRTPWEAVELGSALVRRHAGAVWKPWLLVTVPMLLLLNALCWSIDALWLAAVVMWWFKPAFDRIVLYVLSRAVFGNVPSTWQTFRAQWTWGLRWLPAYLTWRRLGPVRSVYLPVDLLEGGTGEDARTRRRALGSPVYGVGTLATLLFLHFELALVLGMVFAVMLFVPADLLQETAARLWNVFESQQPSVQLASNLLFWIATTALEPFYVGAGFGLYLNRRTQIEAWDIEIVLRRLRARLGQATGAASLLLALWFGGTHLAHAQQVDDRPVAAASAEADSYEPGEADADKADPGEETPRTEATLRDVFGDATVQDEGWRQAIKRAYEDPRVSPKRTVKRWVPKNPRDREEQRKPELGWLAGLFAMIGEYGLWIVAGVLLLVLLATAPRWLRWAGELRARDGREPTEVRREAAAEAAPLPEDIPAAARRLWRGGREREALALVYRASVEAMVERAQVVLIPGATEAHTLRASRQMPLAEDRDAFARAVRTWQIAAYAHGLPDSDEFEDLLGTLARRFHWSAAGATA